MNYDDLEQLFYSGELAACIDGCVHYLIDHPGDVEVIFLLAVAKHDQAYPNGHEAVYETLQAEVIPLLRSMIPLEPENPRARFNILNYMLGNEYDLFQIARPKKHVTAENKDEFIGYAKDLIAVKEHAVYGYDFLIRIHESLGDDDELLLALDQAIAFFDVFFKHERDIKDRNISITWMKKIYLLDRNKDLAMESNILEIIETGLPRFVSGHAGQYFDLAEIAHEHNNFDLALKILLKVVRGDDENDQIQEGLVKWHQRFSDLIDKGFHPTDVLYFQLLVERAYPERLQIAEDYYYQHALEIIQRYPNTYGAFHFAGTYLYEQGDFDQAVSYFRNALAIQQQVTTWRRMVESRFLANGTLEEQVPQFKDIPRDLYNEGVNLDTFLKNMEESAVKEALRNLDVMIYQQSFEAFRKYFEEDKYESDLFGDEHCWAMCCNNLAIAYTAQGNYNDAVEVAQEGLKHAEFQELHYSLVEAAIESNDYLTAQEALQTYFDQYNQETASYYKYLQMQANLVIVNHQLGDEETELNHAKDLLFAIYDHYQENPDISDYDFRDFEAAKNTIETLLYQEYEHKPAAVRQQYYEEIAAKYPDEANPQYNLMQIYNEQEDYQQVNRAARLYMENKQAFLINDFDKAKTLYMIVKSHFLIGQYREGAALFSEYDSFVEQSLESTEYVIWLSYGVKLLSKSGDLEGMESLVSHFQSIYNQENWSYDSDSEGVYLAQATALYQHGNLKEAHKVLDYVLSFDDHDKIADHYKQTWKKPGFLSKFGF